MYICTNTYTYDMENISQVHVRALMCHDLYKCMRTYMQLHAYIHMYLYECMHTGIYSTYVYQAIYIIHTRMQCSVMKTLLKTRCPRGACRKAFRAKILREPSVAAKTRPAKDGIHAWGLEVPTAFRPKWATERGPYTTC